jgi:hypothetical protein
MTQWIEEGFLWLKAQVEEGPWPLLLIGIKMIGINIGAYFLSNYDKLFGAALSIASTIYVCIKIHKELKKPKKDETHRDSDQPAR